MTQLNTYSCVVSQAAEEKQRKKDGKKIKKTADSDVEDEAGSDNDNANEVFAEVKALGLAQGFDGIASLSAKRLDNTKLKPREVPVEVEEVEEEEEVPVLLNPDLPNFKAVLDDADVILQVLDARDPLPFRSAHLEELASAKPDQRVLLVLNKIGASGRMFFYYCIFIANRYMPARICCFLGNVSRRSASNCAVPFCVFIPPRRPRAGDQGKGKRKGQGVIQRRIGCGLRFGTSR